MASPGGSESEDEKNPPTLVVNNVEEFYSQYRVGDELGHGMSSGVRKCSNISGLTETLALKIIDLHSEQLPERRLREDAKREIQILHELRDSPFILRFKDAWESESFVFIMTELCPMGDLFNFISESPNMTEKLTLTIMRQLLDALSFTHSHKIVHRDIKPENVLLSSECPLVIRLADFGLATPTNNDSDLTEVVGTPTYFAPELFNVARSLDNSCIGYGRPVDIWAAGVMMFLLLTGQEPFRHRLLRFRRRKILSGQYDEDTAGWEEVSDSSKTMISRMLTVDPSVRYTADALLHRMPRFDRSSHVCPPRSTKHFRAVVLGVIATYRLRKLMGQVINVDRLYANPLGNKLINRWINSASMYLYSHWLTREIGVQAMAQHETICSYPSSP